MARFLIAWLFNVVALWVATELLGGVSIRDDELLTLVVAGLVFSIVNQLVRPLVTLLAIPLIILTLGVALFFVNLLMLFLTSWIVSGFAIDGFWSGVGATIVVWAVNALLATVTGTRRRDRERDGG